MGGGGGAGGAALNGTNLLPMRTVAAIGLGLALVAGSAGSYAAGAGASPVPHSQLKKAAAGPAKLTGAYELYCPATAFGDVVISATTTATLSPAHPHGDQKFYVKAVQEKITFAQGLAQGLASLTALLGTASLVLQTAGATPASLATPVYQFTITLPKKAPAAGFKFSVPAAAGAPIGPFTASAAKVAVSVSKSQKLTLSLDAKGQQPFPLSCTSFPTGTAKTKPGEPWAGAGQPPATEAIAPVIALG